MTLEELIEKSGMSKYKLAKKAEVNTTVIYKYCREPERIGTMSLMTAYKLAKALGCTIDEMYMQLKGEENEKKK